jgi:hypothetical protein
MSSKDYISDFPEGKVAKSLRKILYPDLSEHDVECISVVLICHLMIEQKMNSVLFRWMSGSIPYMGSYGDQNAVQHNESVRAEVEDNIVKLDFAKKLALIKPLATALWKKDGKAILKDIYKINNIRNDIFHFLKIKKVKFKGKPLTSEEGIELFANVAHQKLLNINDLVEFIERE